MAKSPICGSVKTRLAHSVGPVAATGLARALAARTLRKIARDGRFRTVLAISPDAGRTRLFQALRAGGFVICVSQGRGDLGVRMQRLLDRHCPGDAIVIGSDIPDVTADRIAQAFRLLAGADAVFGPVEDGGYWLVGLRRRGKLIRPLSNIRWSSSHALEDTLANLSGSAVAFAATLWDVDTVEDYARFRRIIDWHDAACSGEATMNAICTKLSKIQ